MSDFLVAEESQVPVAKKRLSISHPEPETSGECTNCTLETPGGSKNLSR